MRVYISGPITGIDSKIYQARFKEVESKLRKAGFWTLNPAEVNKNMPPWFTHGDYMEVCRAELSMCDIICLMDGWEDSIGARMEKGWAEDMKMLMLAEKDI